MDSIYRSRNISKFKFNGVYSPIANDKYIENECKELIGFLLKEIERIDYKKKLNQTTCPSALLQENTTDELIKFISKRLKKMEDDPSGRGYQIIDGLNRNIRSSFDDKNLYRFLAYFFNLDISRLDEKGLLRVLNILIEETNRINKEKIAFGEPKKIEPIKSLD
ncbi:hypothetical protein [Bacillus cabrialesii]|uniref:hypothetical protein n=1 Tax=Bacillus cabrialesii TaxID=2487276 RepID=UPI0036F43B61